MHNTKHLITEAIVSKRINFKEADRIVDFVTPHGKITAIAKGVRKEKSKLAGGIEPFSLSKISLSSSHSELWTLTSATMLDFYQNLITDLEKLDFAGEIVHIISRHLSQVPEKDYFLLLKSTLVEINRPAVNLNLLKAWFFLQLAKTNGENINLFTDTLGATLEPKARYLWDFTEKNFKKDPNGENAEIIKMMKLLLSVSANTALKIKGGEKYLQNIIQIGKNLV